MNAAENIPIEKLICFCFAWYQWGTWREISRNKTTYLDIFGMKRKTDVEKVLIFFCWNPIDRKPNTFFSHARCSFKSSDKILYCTCHFVVNDWSVVKIANNALLVGKKENHCWNPFNNLMIKRIAYLNNPKDWGLFFPVWNPPIFITDYKFSNGKPKLLLQRKLFSHYLSFNRLWFLCLPTLQNTIAK